MHDHISSVHQQKHIYVQPTIRIFKEQQKVYNHGSQHHINRSKCFCPTIMHMSLISCSLMLVEDKVKSHRIHVINLKNA